MAVIVRILHTILLAVFASRIHSTKDNFFPYGSDNNDESLPSGNDETYKMKFPDGLTFPYYGQAYDSIHVQTNGLLSFNEALAEPQTNNILNGFPLDPNWSGDSRRDILIAPYWADVDTTGQQRGDVYFRVSRTEDDLKRAGAIVRHDFPRYPTFKAKMVTIVTWDEVSFFEHDTTSSSDPRNTFQAALITDGTESFVFVFYDVITWTAGTTIGADAESGNAPFTALQAIVGFNKGDGVDSFTEGFPDDRRKLPEESNIGQAGTYAYQVNQDTIENPGCSEDATEVVIHPTSGSVHGGQRIYFYGPCWTTNFMCEFWTSEENTTLLQSISGTVESPSSAYCVPSNFSSELEEVQIKVYADSVKTYSGTYTLRMEETTRAPTGFTPEDGGLEWWVITLIIVGILLVAAVIVAILRYLYQTLMKRKGAKKVPQEEKDTGEELKVVMD